ncbi:hypothetical protein [Corynebacterium minutissimum]|uniref:Uncharacterized protein n=1 Tax=Corynebacterium minutissimum TaxID=38301 RepID=A0A2X4RAP4_9CORY|nr:hypothetical protein [Corynebacterium minutissimum]KHO28801.1 membrane protein [Corynebacterium minutissimum]QPS59430.1 hypothetical protein I6G51_11205 [Corynebacterium minutissimum]QQA79780.1 hypothetical protein I6H49_01655 [Corynebacterium minutissimum]SQH99099.1 Uncharacterised protein [Corynebacterium minutissimum]VEG06571.1 Uncharacterised protein [Corynebacterium minutissimum]
MHYTSWDRSDSKNPVLLVEEGPASLGVFQERSADVEGDHWRLALDDLGASITLEDGRVYRLAGNVKRDKRLEASLDGRTFAFINEAGGDWIVEDSSGVKVAQFSSKNSGVRKAILEFEGENSSDSGDLDDGEVAGLSWFTRIILEARTQRTAIPIIATLVLLSIVAIITVLI